MAAPQVGIPERFFITAWGEVFLNPKIVGRQGEIKITEQCLSLPGVSVLKTRATRITLSTGATYDGLKAVVIQHEIDHLDGILIND